MPYKVVIAESLDQVCVDWIAERANMVFVPISDGDEQVCRALRGADGLVIRTYTVIDDAFLDRTPSLKVIGRAGVGLDNLDLDACRRRGVSVVYTPEANTQAVIEYVIAIILDDLRPRLTLDAPIDIDAWSMCRKGVNVGSQLDTLTLGILGFGRIGKKLGRVAHAVGMKLLVNDLLPEATLHDAVEFPFEFVDKPTLYRESDIVSIHADGRPSNHHVIGAEAFSQLNPQGMLINAARGTLIDNAALLEWLTSTADTGGRAVLDVHVPEPIPADYPFWGVANVRILPHLAARTYTALRNMSWVVKDVLAVLEGKTPQYPAF